MGDGAESVLNILPPLPRKGSSDEAVREWIRQSILILDDTPRRPFWRWHVQDGKGLAQILAESAPRQHRLDIRIPVGEMRVVLDAAKDRELGVRTYMRAALGTCMVACDGYSPEYIPSLTAPGLLRPR